MKTTSSSSPPPSSRSAPLRLSRLPDDEPLDHESTFGRYLRETRVSPTLSESEKPLAALMATRVHVDVAALAADATAALAARSFAARALPPSTIAAPLEHVAARARSEVQLEDDEASPTASIVSSAPPARQADPLVVTPVLVSGGREVDAVHEAAALLEDPALHVSLNLNTAVVVVDGLHIRLATHDGGASVTVSGKRADVVVDGKPELRHALADVGLTLHSVHTAEPSAETANDRRGKAVVDVDDDPRAVPHDVDYEQVSLRVKA